MNDDQLLASVLRKAVVSEGSHVIDVHQNNAMVFIDTGWVDITPEEAAALQRLVGQ